MVAGSKLFINGTGDSLTMLTFQTLVKPFAFCKTGHSFSLHFPTADE